MQNRSRFFLNPSIPSIKSQFVFWWWKMESTAHSLFERRWSFYEGGRKNVKWFFAKKGDSHLDRQAVNKQCQKKNCKRFPPLFQSQTLRTYTLSKTQHYYVHIYREISSTSFPLCYLKLLTTYVLRTTRIRSTQCIYSCIQSKCFAG